MKHEHSYPAFQSYKAVIDGTPDLHAQWLTYWVVNSYFTVFEYFADIGLAWIPFYYEGKVALLIWLVAPRFNGALKLYNRFINPYLEKYENDIDTGLIKVQEKGSAQIKELAKGAIERIQKKTQAMVPAEERDKIIGNLIMDATTIILQQQQGSSQPSENNKQSSTTITTAKMETAVEAVSINKTSSAATLVVNKEKNVVETIAVFDRKDTKEEADVNELDESIARLHHRESSAISLSQFRDSFDEDD